VKEVVVLIVFYIVFMLIMSSFLWGRSLERAYEFHKDMYWGRWIGRERYFALSRWLAVIAMIAATVGCILVFLHI